MSTLSAEVGGGNNREGSAGASAGSVGALGTGAPTGNEGVLFRLQLDDGGGSGGGGHLYVGKA